MGYSLFGGNEQLASWLEGQDVKSLGADYHQLVPWPQRVCKKMTQSKWDWDSRITDSMPLGDFEESRFPELMILYMSSLRRIS